MRSNCFLFVLALYWRRYRKGDARYIAIRWSKLGPYPHFLYVHNKHWIAYTPLRPTDWYCAPWTFEGKVKWGDL